MGRLVLLVAKQCTKFEICSFSHSEDISWGVKFENWPPDPDHAPLRDGLSPTARTCYDKSTHQISSAYLHPLRKYERRCKMLKMG